MFAFYCFNWKCSTVYRIALHPLPLVPQYLISLVYFVYCNYSLVQLILSVCLSLSLALFMLAVLCLITYFAPWSLIDLRTISLSFSFRFAQYIYSYLSISIIYLFTRILDTTISFLFCVGEQKQLTELGTQITLT